MHELTRIYRLEESDSEYRILATTLILRQAPGATAVDTSLKVTGCNISVR